ncbi:MAG: hypothetical protein R3B56_08985 [Candidatus Scalinduaceae bacterium]
MSMNEKELLKLLSAHEWKDIALKKLEKAHDGAHDKAHEKLLH